MSEGRSQQAADLAEALGDDGLEVLVAAYGGVRIRVHSRPRPDTDLARRLGGAIYARLQAVYAGEEIDIPTLASTRWQGRAARVLAMSAAGSTAAEIARAEGCTLRWVRELLARARDPQRCGQLSLDL